MGVTVDWVLTQVVVSVSANNDFEHGFGVWTNPTQGDNFDWLLGQSGTQTQYTGPSTDHTLGNAQGWLGEFALIFVDIPLDSQPDAVFFAPFDHSLGCH